MEVTSLIIYLVQLCEYKSASRERGVGTERLHGRGVWVKIEDFLPVTERLHRRGVWVKIEDFLPVTECLHRRGG